MNIILFISIIIRLEKDYESRDWSYGLSINQERAMNLLIVVLAVANDTPYVHAALRYVGSVFREGDWNNDEVLCYLHFF